MDYMYNACSTTARRGALDWAPVFEKANLPIFEKLYESVRNGTETRKSLEFNGRSTYREDLAKELEVINNQEMWRAGMLYAATGVFRRLMYFLVSQARLFGHCVPTTSLMLSRLLHAKSTILVHLTMLCIMIPSVSYFEIQRISIEILRSRSFEP